MSRRALVAGLGLAWTAGIASVADAAPATPAPAASWQRIRRIVTTDDAAGRGIVLHDGEPTNSFELNGTRITRLWETPAVPAAVPVREDAGASAGNAYRPGFEGTGFYVAELPGGARAPRIPMHRSTTLDYMAVLSGRIALVVDERELELAAGDTLVQAGTNHTWVNRWPEPCVLLFVVVAARPSMPPAEARD